MGGFWNLGQEKACIEYTKLDELFCGSLEDNAESSSDDGGLPCDIPEGRLRVT